MTHGYQQGAIPKQTIRLLGKLFLGFGVLLLTVSISGFFQIEEGSNYGVGIGVVSSVFGAVLLLNQKISKQTSLIGTISFYSIAIAGTILALYNLHIIDLLIWIVSASSVIAMFFTLCLETHSSLNSKLDEERDELFDS